jgi:hypothetical protein
MDASSGVYALYQSQMIDLLQAGRPISHSELARIAVSCLDDAAAKRSGLPFQLVAALTLASEDLRLALKLTLAIYASPLKSTCSKCGASRQCLRRKESFEGRYHFGRHSQAKAPIQHSISHLQNSHAGAPPPSIKTEHVARGRTRIGSGPYSSLDS